MRFNSAVCIFFLWCFTIGLPSTRAQRSLIFTNLTVENGLSQNSVMAIAQDSTGLIWLGTRQGVNRYDGYHFKNYSNHQTDKKGNQQQEITSLITDYLGTLWAGTTNGLQKYNLEKDRFEKVEQLNNQLIELLFQDDDHNLWIGTQKGLKLLVDRQKHQFKTFLFNNKVESPINNIYAICKDRKNQLWVATGDGLVKVSYKKGIFSFKKISFLNHPMNGYITAIAKDSEQNIWVGTTNGLYLLNDSGQLSKTFVHTEGNRSSLIHNDIRELMPDKNGVMWIGTQNGLSIFNPSSNSFSNYQHDPETTGSISHNSIHHLFKDRTQNIWIGTYFGGVNVIYPVSTKFKIYRNGKSNTISGNVVSGIAEGKPNQLWIGTEGAGINLLNKTSNTFISYKHDPANFSSISSNLVKVLVKDKYNQSNMVIGTHRGIINILNTSTGKFQRVENVKDAKGTVGSAEIIALAFDMNGTLWIGSLNGLSTLQSKNGVYPSKTLRSPLNDVIKNKDILNLFVDSKNNLWIGTSTKLYCYNLGYKKLKSFSQANNLDSLQSGYINCVTESKNGDILIGTNSGGLSIYNSKSSAFKSYTENNGLVNNNVLGIVEDNSGNLWISTANGLSEFNPITKRFRNYTKSDGLAGNEFNNRSYFKDSQGEIFFGGINGLTSFFPSEIQSNNYISPLVFTSLRLFNKLVEVDEDNGILNNNLNLINELDFSYDQNNFTLEFSLLNYVKPDKNRYAYKLEGYDKDWKYDSTPIASYTNLPSGNYRFVVKGSNNDGIPGSTTRTLNIHIKPAPWLSWWAYFCYFIIFSSILFLTLRYFFIRALLKRTENVQQMKLQFFTHVSHEIRTPLTLILGPLESLLKNTTHLPELHKQVIPIKNNADRLLRLVTELMDFRKTETGNMKLHLEELDIVQFMQQIFDAFRDLATSKQINYHLDIPTEPIKIWIDSIQLEKVFYNLLSNAFKFTNKNGNISVAVKALGQQISIEVRDNGIGIPEESKDKLFSDFFQIENSGSGHIGSGIGLALSKSIVVAHGGEITIESRRETAEKPGDTKFTVTLNKERLKVNADYEKTERVSNGNFQNVYVPKDAELALTENVGTHEETILLVEDNQEIRAMLRGFLSPFYHIAEAENGQLGWETATELLPDLVICDIMMPIMDGLALCGNLKTDDRTAHIPVILLTAMDSHLQKIDGLETGADIYITKPFSTELLLLNVRNLLQARKAMRKKYTEEVNLKPQDITINKTDHEFMLKVVQFVDDKMADQDFVIQDLANEVGMSQPVLYKKIRAVTDLSVNDFIKSIRLKKALSLLETNQYTISEISYLVGFNDTKYFSREFKKQFGDTPKAYLKKAQPNNND